MGLLYLGLSNYCLTYAVISGESHHEVESAGGLDHHESHDHGEPADHEHGSSDSCCVKFNDAGALIPAPPQLLVKAIVVVLPGFLGAAFTKAPVASSANSYERPDHGPPKVASQVYPSYRASRAPPVLA